MLLWIILAVIAALVCLLLSMKVGARVIFGPTVQAWVKVGPVMIQVYPMPEKKKKKPKKEKKGKKEQEQQKAEKEKRNITFDAVWQLANALIEPALDAMDRVRRGLHIRRLNLRLIISDPNPAAAAQRYGKLNAVLWPLIAVVENLVTVERRDVRLDLDFASHKSSIEGELLITMRVYHGVCILLADGLKLLRPVLQFMKMTKPAKDTEKQADVNKETKDTAAA